MVSLKMTKDEANIMQNALERYVHHLRVEITHTNRWEFRNAMKQREQFLDDIIDRLKKKIIEDSK
jgi:hypothetical protein